MTNISAIDKEVKIIKASPAEQVMLIISAACTVLILGWVLWLLRFGIDFADESFYFVWISNPFEYPISTSQFGFIYHPLYLLFDGNIAALRRANILFTFCLAWMASDIFLKKIFAEVIIESWQRRIVSAAIATSIFVFLRLWLPTPSYNWLALQALLVGAIGLLYAEKKYTKESQLGWILIGVAGWLAFMAKPTTAAALGLCSIFYLMGTGKMNVRLLIISITVAGALLVLSALTIDGSILAFIYRLKGGLKYAELLGGGHQFEAILRLDNFQLGMRSRIVLGVGTVYVVVSAYLFQAKTKALIYAGSIQQIAIATAIFLVVFGFTRKTLNDVLNGEDFQQLLLWIVPLSAILLGLSVYKFQGFFASVTRPRWVLALTFLVFPHVFAFGTGNNYWWFGGLAGFFWILSGLVFLGPIKGSRKFIATLLPLCFAGQLITVALVLTSIELPYYQPSLREDAYKVNIRTPGSTLWLSNSYGTYISDAIGLANRAGFKMDTPMLDLSGHSPGVLYAVGATNIGQPWMIGTYPGYSGADKLAAEMMYKVSCDELARAWLLIEPKGPVRISPNMLASFGADLSKDFQLVGTFETAKGVGGFQEVQSQQFLKPTRTHDVAVKACLEAKEASKKNFSFFH